MPKDFKWKRCMKEVTAEYRKKGRKHPTDIAKKVCGKIKSRYG